MYLIQRDEPTRVLAFAVLLVGLAPFLWGCTQYSMDKGHFPYLGPFGVLVLYSLPDKHKVRAPFNFRIERRMNRKSPSSSVSTSGAHAERQMSKNSFALLQRGDTMRTVRLITTAIATLVFTVACMSTTLAPGADKVRITKVSSDVSGCTAVGNVKAPRNSDGSIDAVDSDAVLRNQTIGLGGNTILGTSSVLSVLVEGIAYRCP